VHSALAAREHVRLCTFFKFIVRLTPPAPDPAEAKQFPTNKFAPARVTKAGHKMENDERRVEPREAKFGLEL
jgi:hypothetical protein